MEGIWRPRRHAVLLSLALAAYPGVVAQSCISLAKSEACPGFNRSSISTDSNLVALYPFLTFVSDAKSFDKQLQDYVSTDFSKLRYQQQIGCSNLDLANTTSLYARYTLSVICNSLVQNSITPCKLSTNRSRPLCADSCAENALSEQSIASSPDLCGQPGDGVLPQIRADFTTCALPPGSLDPTCVNGALNEPDNCGFSSNLGGLCGYCAASSPNATDSCCVNSKAESRCSNVRLPTTTSMPPLFTSTSSSSRPTGTSAANRSSSDGSGLSGGAIAGIVIGSVVGALLLLILIVGLCILFRRRRTSSQQGSIFNQPSPQRQGPMSFVGTTRATSMPPGGRVTRMSALEAGSASDPHSSGGIGGYHGSSDEYNDSPESQRSLGAVGGMAMMQKRDGSLSSRSHLNNESSPGHDFSSPEGIGSGQSEQLPFFKDYYSQDEIHPNDMVATLWAYQPRANDEFELERGDMLKVVGIWDDGWATGLRAKETVEEWEARRKENRDSGVSNGSHKPRPQSPTTADGDVKAFPLVCVCLPQHWRKTIEGDTTEGATTTTEKDLEPPLDKP